MARRNRSLSRRETRAPSLVDYAAQLYDVTDQPGNAFSVCRGYHGQLAESQAGKLRTRRVLAGAVDLVDHNDDGLVQPTQTQSNFLIGCTQSLPCIHKKQHRIAFIQRQFRLLFQGALQIPAAAEQPASVH